MALESSIQSDIIDYINKLPCGRAENVSGNAQQSGRADINACVNGEMYKIEVKTKDTAYGRKGATTKQRLYLEKWARAGAISCVVYNVDDVKYMVHEPFIQRVENMGAYIPEDKISLLQDIRKSIKPSGRGKWYDVQNKRWVDISY